MRCANIHEHDQHQSKGDVDTCIISYVSIVVKSLMAERIKSIVKTNVDLKQIKKERGRLTERIIIQTVLSVIIVKKSSYQMRTVLSISIVPMIAIKNTEENTTESR